jgi:hypothetical protein
MATKNQKRSDLALLFLTTFWNQEAFIFFSPFFSSSPYLPSSPSLTTSSWQIFLFPKLPLQPISLAADLFITELGHETLLLWTVASSRLERTEHKLPIHTSRIL